MYRLEAYLDNSATTRPCRAAIEATVTAMERLWGNPSSLHQKGWEAQQLVKQAKEALAQKLSCRPGEVLFCGSGTQANNLAVLGAAHAQKKKGNRVVISAVEHPSVMKAAERLAQEGFDVQKLSVDRYGTIDLEEAERLIDANTVLVSVMKVNNELGTVEPVEGLRPILRRKQSPALLHVDAVQAFGKLPLSAAKLGADLITVSAHKVHGPKGVGALYVKEGVRLTPTVVGGEQEGGVFPGTEATPAIAGFGAAVRAMKIPPIEKIQALRDAFAAKLRTLDAVVLNSGDDALPYIVNFSLPGWRSDTVLNVLSDRGVYVSSGSACAKGHRSPVLTAAGLPVERIDGAIRVSLCDETDAHALDACFEAVRFATQTLRKKS